MEAAGTKQETGGQGTGVLLQSSEEWAARNRQLSNTIRCLITRHLHVVSGRALDVGCQAGELTDAYGDNLRLEWVGIDPDIQEQTRSPGGASLQHGFAHKIAFGDGDFDCVVFANVYEHIPP